MLPLGDVQAPDVDKLQACVGGGVEGKRRGGEWKARGGEGKEAGHLLLCSGSGCGCRKG